MDNFDPYSVLLAIATNKPELLVLSCSALGEESGPNRAAEEQEHDAGGCSRRLERDLWLYWRQQTRQHPG